MMRALILAVVVATGCTEFQDFDVKCGNGVIDEDEDCDSREGCEQCRRTCKIDSDCVDENVPGQYLCGADDICHAPSGVFTRDPVAQFAYVVGQGAVADMDGDQIGDIVGFSDITLDVRFGDLDVSLATRSTELLPYSNANIALRKFHREVDENADEVTELLPLYDVLVPTPDGIVAYTATSSKAIVAYPFAAAPTGQQGNCASGMGVYNPIATFTLDPYHIAFVRRANATGLTSLAVVDLSNGTCTEHDACNLIAPDPSDPMQLPIAVDHYAAAGSPLTSLIGIGVPVSDKQQRVCVLRFNAGSPSTITPVTPLGAPLTTAPGPFAFANAVSTSPCPALYTAREMKDGVNYHAATGVTSSTCTLNLSGTQLLQFGMEAFPVGHIPLVPAIPGQADDAIAMITGSDYAAQTRFFSLAGTIATFMYQSPRPLYPIRYGDLDGDGRIEGIASVLGQGPQGEPDLDILYRTETAIPSFVPFRIKTQAPPTYLAVGDFDGNLLADIAYTQRIGVGDERLMIAYGTRDRPLDAVEIAKFNAVSALAHVDVRDSIDPNGAALDDLLVVEEVMAGPPLITVLHGNPQRSMLAYWDPRGTGGTTPDQLFFAAVAGNFIAADGTDVLVFERRPSPDLNAPPGLEVVSVYLAEGQQTSQALSQSAPATQIDAAGAVCPDNIMLCTNGAQYLAWPIEGEGREIVLAVNGSRPTKRSIVTIDPNPNNTKVAMLTDSTDPSTLVPAQTFVFTAFGADVDRDTNRDLVLSFGDLGPFDVPGDDEVRICDVSDVGFVEKCDSAADVTALPAGEPWVCEAAERGLFTAAGRHDPLLTSTADDVLVLCKRGEGDAAEGRVFKLVPDEGTPGKRFRAQLVLENAKSFEILAIGDVNGDKLTDVIGVSFDDFTSTPVLNIHLQCDAIDVGCRTVNFVVEPPQ